MTIALVHRMRAAPYLVAFIVAFALLLDASAPSAVAHGEEEEALRQTPARALVRQALALLIEAEDPVEAHERLEAALESDDTEGVNLGALRRARRALAEGDHDLAQRQINAALAPEQEPPAAEPEQAEEEHEEGTAPEQGAPAEEEAPEKALEHAAAFEPNRGSAEWIALAVGAGLLLAALGVLWVRRRAT